MKIFKKILLLACFNSLGGFMVAAHAFDFPTGDWKGQYYLNINYCNHVSQMGDAVLTVTEVQHSFQRVRFSGYLKLYEPRQHGSVPAGFGYYFPSQGGTGELYPNESGMSESSSGYGTVLWPLNFSAPNWPNNGYTSEPSRIAIKSQVGSCEVRVTVYAPTASRKK